MINLDTIDICNTLHLPVQQSSSSHILIEIQRFGNSSFGSYCLHPCFYYCVPFLCFCEFCTCYAINNLIKSETKLFIFKLLVRTYSSTQGNKLYSNCQAKGTQQCTLSLSSLIWKLNIEIRLEQLQHLSSLIFKLQVRPSQLIHIPMQL